MEIIKKHIDGGRGFDWGRASEDYAKYRDVYPPVVYERLVELGLCVKGQRVLDIGTGTGVFPRNMYKYGAEFVGADISENQIEYAKRLSEKAGMNITYIVSPAEELEFPDKHFDVVSACQCFIYFDKKIILPKIHRFLKDGGHFCKLSMIWLVEDSEIAATSEKIVLKHNPHWSDHSVKRYTEVLPEEAAGLFEVADFSCFNVPLTFTRESWHGRMLSCRGIGASGLSEKEREDFNKEHMQYLETLPESFEIEHYATVFTLRKI
ncbi:MAG: methyltransferase domain-containing protein [Oscillospiraceae bacterium]|nr:methyltransferase domain-containing protein [Oscillospiraceae bacterium]